MFINLLNSFPLYSHTFEVVKHDRLKFVISALAFGILLSGVIYWIYSKFWEERQVEVLDVPVCKAVPKESPVDVSEKVQKQNEEMLDEIFDMDQEVSKEPMVGEKSDQIEKECIALPFKLSSDIEEIDVDQYLGDFLTPDYGYSLFENQFEDDLSDFLAEEKTRFYYENMFLRYEGVKAALEDCERSNKHEWVNFCNVSFALHHEETKDQDFAWEFSISIDPAQRYQAWKILAQELESTNLCLAGRIHSTDSEKTGHCPAGKEISLFVLKSQAKELEWQHFLSLIASRFYAEGIQPDSRPLNCDPELTKFQWNAVIPCKGVPTYFNYIHSFQVLSDHLFINFTARHPLNNEITEGTVALSDGRPSVIKESYYRALEEKERHNPMKVYDPFAKLLIEPL